MNAGFREQLLLRARANLARNLLENPERSVEYRDYRAAVGGMNTAWTFHRPGSVERQIARDQLEVTHAKWLSVISPVLEDAVRKGLISRDLNEWAEK